MNANEIDYSDFDSDSDFEDLVSSGKDIQVIYFDNIEQYLQSQKELNKLGGFDHNSNTAQYIVIKPVNC